MDGCETDVQDIEFETSVIQLHWKLRSDFTLRRPTREQRLRLLPVDWNRPLIPISRKPLEYIRGEKSRGIFYRKRSAVIIYRSMILKDDAADNVRGTEAALCSYHALINGMINCL